MLVTYDDPDFLENGAVHDHIVSGCKDNTLCDTNTLHVVGVISNPARYHTRWKIFQKWYARMKATPNVKVYVLELAFGNRQFQVTDPTEPTHMQLRTDHELWHKENMINIAVRKLLPKDWHYMCWCDTDVFFRNKGWAQETMHQLQHYHVVQPWSDAVDLDFHGGIIKHYESFCSVHLKGEKMQTNPLQPYKYAHTGYAWACTKMAWENMLGGLMDRCIVGSADHHQAWAMIGKWTHSVHKDMDESYKIYAQMWQDAIYPITHGHLGFVKGRIEHVFHGPKINRSYRERWRIFIEERFDPFKDLRYDHNGLLYIVGKPELEHRIRLYMRSRNEDSIDRVGLPNHHF